MQTGKNKDSLPQYDFITSYFFYPKLWHKLLSFCLLPISCCYFLITIFIKKTRRKKDFGLKILSIGNLTSGGSGKTPFCITLARHLESLGYTDIFIILRGYKRKSKGLLRVSENGKILCDVSASGDEAMLIANSVQSNVIVSENRELAISHAKELDAQIIILDDAYRFSFQKFDILLEPEITPCFPFVLPSGYYRFPPSFYKKCDLHLKEGIHYKRLVNIVPMCAWHENARYILATAIANPNRLATYLPQNVVYYHFLPDHAGFCEKQLKDLMYKYNATHILMTEKDYVKCKNFNLPIVILSLSMQIDSYILEIIESYLNTP